MKVLIQWSTTNPTDWAEYSITSMSQVQALPRKPVPDDSSLIDSELGWITAVNIQGVTLSGDHVGFSIDKNDHLVVGCWNDDVSDWAAVPFGWVYTFGPLAPDPALPASPGYALLYPNCVGQIDGANYKINTQQTVTQCADTSTLQALAAGGEAWAQSWIDDASVLPWVMFPYFAPDSQLHGIWLEQSLMTDMKTVQSTHGWREWSD